MGAWIEIIEEFENILNGAVAPFVGAWIEIFLFTDNEQLSELHSLQGGVD